MNSLSATTYTDLNSLAELKAQAGQDPDATLDQVAKQFESLLMHQMLKAMREASLGEGMLDNDQSLFYRDMFDQQLAIHLAESGGMGLAEVIKRQLGGEAGDVPPAKTLSDYRRMAISRPENGLPLVQLQKELSVRNPDGATSESSADARALQAASETDASGMDFIPQSPSEFVSKLWPWAKEAASLLGLKPQALLAQAALESGWGKHVMRFADGNPANNLFGIKADQRWDGNKVTVPTIEYEQGVAVRKKAHFRAYESYRESFFDYVQFLKTNPRYEKALKSAGDPVAYFEELQRAGYATDPEYARKISAVLEGKEMTRALSQLKSAGHRSL